MICIYSNIYIIYILLSCCLVGWHTRALGTKTKKKKKKKKGTRKKTPTFLPTRFKKKNNNNNNNKKGPDHVKKKMPAYSSSLSSSAHLSAGGFPRRRGRSGTGSRGNYFGSFNAGASPSDVCATKMATAQQQVQNILHISKGAPAPTTLCGPNDPIQVCRETTRKGDIELGEKLLCQLCNAFHSAHKKEADDRVESAWALHYPREKVHQAFMAGEDHIMCTETCGQDFEAAASTILDALLCKLQHDGATAKCALEQYRKLVEDYRCFDTELKHCAPGPHRTRLSQDRKNAHKQAHQVWCSVFGPLRLSRQVLAGPGIDGSFTQKAQAGWPGSGRYRPCITRGYLYNLASFMAKNLLVRNEREVLRLCRTDMLRAPMETDPACVCPSTSFGTIGGGASPASVSDAAMVKEVLRLWGMHEPPFKDRYVRTIGQALHELLTGPNCAFSADQLFKAGSGACPSGPDGPYSAFRRCFDSWRPGLGCHSPEDDARARKYLSVFADPQRGALGFYLSFAQKFAAAIGDSVHCVGEYPDPNEHNNANPTSTKLATSVERGNVAGYESFIKDLHGLVGKYQLDRSTCSSVAEFWKDVTSDLQTGLVQGVVGHHVRRAGTAGRHAWTVQFECELGRIADVGEDIPSFLKKVEDGQYADQASADKDVLDADRESKDERLFFVPYRDMRPTAEQKTEKEWRTENKYVSRARQLVKRTWHPCLMDSEYVENHLVSKKTFGRYGNGNDVYASELFGTKKNHFAYDSTAALQPYGLVAKSDDVNRLDNKKDTQTSEWRSQANGQRAVQAAEHFSKYAGTVNGAHFAATLDLGLRDYQLGIQYWGNRIHIDNEMEWHDGAIQCFYRCLREKATNFTTQLETNLRPRLQKKRRDLEYLEQLHDVICAADKVNFVAKAKTYFQKNKDLLGVVYNAAGKEFDGKRENKEVLGEVFTCFESCLGNQGERTELFSSDALVTAFILGRSDSNFEGDDWKKDLKSTKGPSQARDQYYNFIEEPSVQNFQKYVQKVQEDKKGWLNDGTSQLTASVKDWGKSGNNNLDKKVSDSVIFSLCSTAVPNIFKTAATKALDKTKVDTVTFEKFLEHCIAPMFKHSAQRDCVLQELRAMRADVCPDDRKDAEVEANIQKIDPAVNSGGKTGHPDDLSWKDFAVTLNQWTPTDHCRSAFVHAILCPADMVNDSSQRVLFARVFNMLESQIKQGMFRTAATVLAQTAKENSCGIGDNSDDLWP